MNISASKVNAYQGCQRLFYYQYIKKPFEIPEKSYFVTGKLVHRTLELFHKALDGTPQERMGNAFKAAFKDQDCEKHIKNKTIKEYDLFDCKGMLADYLAYLENTYTPSRVVATEKMFKIVQDGVTLSGVIDRIDSDVLGDMTVIDYKTGKTVVGVDEEVKSVQLPIYALYLKKEMGALGTVNARYINLKFIGSKDEQVDFQVDDSMIDDAMAKCKELSEHLNNKKAFNRNKKYKYCYACDFKHMCSEEKDA
jgi:RecB family exonuclease